MGTAICDGGAPGFARVSDDQALLKQTAQPVIEQAVDKARQRRFQACETYLEKRLVQKFEVSSLMFQALANLKC